MNSRIYSGTVHHRRLRPLEHAFAYRLDLLYLDLDELPQLFDRVPCWSARGPNLAWFRRADHLGDAGVPLREAVADLVEARLGRRPAGRIALLTQPRYFGYAMNPVSFYYCWSAAGDCVEYLVAEVHNTPWGERYCYVVDCRLARGSDGSMLASSRKAFHVSPFMGMAQDYHWRVGAPGRTLQIAIASRDADGPLFDARLALAQRPLTARNLLGLLLRFPPQTFKVIGAIYWQALRLWYKGLPVHRHPDRKLKTGATS